MFQAALFLEGLSYLLSLISANHLSGSRIAAMVLNDRHLSGHFVAAIALRNPTNLDYSNQVLDQCQNPTLFAFNSMIRAYSKSSTPSKSIHFYNKILRSSDSFSLDNYTFNFLVRTCAQLLARETGPTVHGGLIKHGFGLLFMYAELGSLDPCHRVFKEIVEPDLVCQTAMVSACARCGDVGFARDLFDEMPQRDPVAWNAMIERFAYAMQEALISQRLLSVFHHHLRVFLRFSGSRTTEITVRNTVRSGSADFGSCEEMPMGEENLGTPNHVNGEVEARRLVIKTCPEICEDCIGERESRDLMRKLDYCNEDMYVYFVHGNQAPTSN